ncbi:hypothetical protein DFJ58DRAFT_672529, partial [Suillus subalutaceus]|uniref:uncharacterized protein n=1 Tax=Suillus subalutaceus TaxID=48586 RepID=UPI001B866411
LFSFETAEGSWSPLTKPWFLARRNEIWVSAGHPSMPGHAFRIGGAGATELLLEEVHPNVGARVVGNHVLSCTASDRIHPSTFHFYCH